MIEDILNVKDLLNFNQDLWAVYYELCQEDSRFSGLTKIPETNCIAILDPIDFRTSIYKIRTESIYKGHYYKLMLLESLGYGCDAWGISKTLTIPETELKQNIISMFNECVESYLFYVR